LLQQARFLAYNSPKTVWGPGSAPTRWGRGLGGREKERGKRKGRKRGKRDGDGPPNTDSWIRPCEGVQIRATKLVKDVEHLHYNDRLEHLWLMCLHTRRIRSDLIDTYKIINSYFLIRIKVADEAIRRNYLKEDLGWISENLHLVTE